MVVPPMYFDVTSRVEIPESHLERALATVAREISVRRGRILAMSKDIILFSAPFWRVNGVFYFLVRQLPLGVSHGVFEVVRENGASLVRFRISLFWLRVCIAAIVLLLTTAVLSPSAGNRGTLLIVLLTSVVTASVIYIAAVVETRRYFKRMLLSGVSVAKDNKPCPGPQGRG